MLEWADRIHPIGRASLMKGSIVAAAEGDADAAQRAKAMGRALIETHRR